MPYFLLFALFVFATPVTAGQFTLAVASNFLSPAQQLAAQFQRESGHKVRIISGSTGKLYAQIINGAPFDLFLAANQREPKRLEQQGRIVKGSRCTYARGQVALMSRNEKRVLQPEMLKQASRLAMANPKLAPYGQAAQEVLQRMSLDNLKAKTVLAENVAQAFLFVKSGNTPFGFVALSQVKDYYQGEVPNNIWVPDSSWYSAIEQQAVLLKRAKKNQAAVDFIAFLKQPKTHAQIVSFGYAE